MAKKILVISMKAGYGHIKAAQALEEYAKKNLPDFWVNHIDLGEIDSTLGKFFQRFYDVTSSRFPKVWGSFYKAFDRELVANTFQKMSEFRGLFNLRAARYLAQQSPEGIIFTNVVAAPVMAPICREILPKGVLSVVVTDYHGHSYYNVPCLDRYFVAIDEVKDDLARVGVEREKISVTGIPIGVKFFNNYNQGQLKKKLGFANDLPTVLFISRLGKDFVIPTVKGLLVMEPKINLAVVCGGNDDLYRDIRAAAGRAENFKLVNWTNRIDEYMKAADVVVSKPGGLIISECLALGKPIIMTDPIPGQEEQNAIFMARHNYGKRVAGREEILEGTRRYLSGKDASKAARNRNNPCELILKSFNQD